MYQVYRRPIGQPSSTMLIGSAFALGFGGFYALSDPDVPSTIGYEYTLTVINNNATSVSYGPVTVLPLTRRGWLPSVVR